MRSFAAVVFATSVLATSAFAAGTETASLTPGKPASVKQAQMEGNSVLMLVGVAVVAGGIALVASGNSKAGPAVTTTGTGGIP